MFVMGLIAGLAVWGLLMLRKCFFRVDEGHIAVLTRFGAALTVPDKHDVLATYGPGLHGKLPWDHPIVISMMEQTLDLSGQAGGRSAMADDGTVLRFDSILRYRPVEEGLSRFLFELRAPLEHITHLFTCLLRNAIANFAPSERPPVITESATTGTPVSAALAAVSSLDSGGSYAVIRRERRRLNAEIEMLARERIGDRYGVRFSAVDLTDILPPDELADALNAVMQARADADARYFRAEADCRQRVLAAHRGVEIAARRAEAHETEIRTLGAALGELEQAGSLADYVSRRRAEVLAEARTLYLKEEA